MSKQYRIGPHSTHKTSCSTSSALEAADDSGAKAGDSSTQSKHLIPDLQASDAVLVVDVQHDFCAQGALAVPAADEILPLVNQILAQAEYIGAMVIASRDWHPANHCSFSSQGGPWPQHCVAHSQGAAFHAQLQLPADTIIINKATTADEEQYSAAHALVDPATRPLPATSHAKQVKTLTELLTQQATQRIWLVGLALDYCVKHTALELAQAGFDTYIYLPATRAIDGAASATVISELCAAGITIYTAAKTGKKSDQSTA